MVMRKFVFLSFLQNISLFAQSQSKIDIKEIFKIHLVLNDRLNVINVMPDSVKSDSFCMKFQKYNNIKLKKLSVSNQLVCFGEDKFTFYEYTDITILPDKEFEGQNLQMMDFLHNKLSYVLAVNGETGLCYRLKGFENNDFLNFLKDFNELILSCTFSAHRKYSRKQIFNKYKIENLDFSCLYKGLIKGHNNDTNKSFPCLVKCSDAFIIYDNFVK